LQHCVVIFELLVAGCVWKKAASDLSDQVSFAAYSPQISGVLFVGQAAEARP
jgi:hypothetical protein